MPSEHTFNFRSWLSRMGFKGGVVPSIIPVVQPVQVVGDASLLVPPLLPATACYGGRAIQNAAQHGALQIRSLAPGGTLVRRFSAVAIANCGPTWVVRDAPIVFTVETDLTAHNYGTGLCTSIVTVGTVLPGAILPTLDSPYSYRAPRDPVVLDDIVYIPTGSYFIYCESLINIGLAIEVVIQDLPAAAGPE